MPADRARLFGKRWVHVFEEDTPAGEVYRPDSGQIPLSRRPRRVLELNADGGARVWASDAADRPQAATARWREQDGVITLSIPATRGGEAVQLRVAELSATRMLIAR